jgi:uncharacterized membrane protein YeaQ/YmgE (transglycosylase-associated protein family)
MALRYKEFRSQLQQKRAELRSIQTILEKHKDHPAVAKLNQRAKDGEYVVEYLTDQTSYRVIGINTAYCTFVSGMLPYSLNEGIELAPKNGYDINQYVNNLFLAVGITSGAIIPAGVRKCSLNLDVDAFHLNFKAKIKTNLHLVLEFGKGMIVGKIAGFVTARALILTGVTNFSQNPIIPTIIAGIAGAVGGAYLSLHLMKRYCTTYVKNYLPEFDDSKLKGWERVLNAVEKFVADTERNARILCPRDF